MRFVAAMANTISYAHSTMCVQFIGLPRITGEALCSLCCALGLGLLSSSYQVRVVASYNYLAQAHAHLPRA